MTGGFPTMTGGSRRADVAAAVTAVLVEYVRSMAGDAGVLRMLALAGELRTEAALREPDSWSTHEQAINLLHSAAQVTGDGEIGLHLGERMLAASGPALVARFRTPRQVAEEVIGDVAAFTPVVTSQKVALDELSATVRVMTRAGVRRHPHLCQFTRGVLSQIPVPFGQPPAEVTETECQAKGGRFCLYTVQWHPLPTDDPPAGQRPSLGADPTELVIDPSTRMAQLVSQLRQSDERLEGVFSTAAELLGEEDLDTLLARITSRAARAVSASQYLLAVRTSPEAEVTIHHHGFDEGEARALANELWNEGPDDDRGARLIVDIASSRRRYGRLMAVYPPGVTYFESERRMLALYAGYAATALDVVTSLEEARRSHDTARALLEFSGALSRATTTDATAQLLADAVPAVIQCEEGTVMLWDRDRRELTLRAVSTPPVVPTEGAEVDAPVAPEAGTPTDRGSDDGADDGGADPAEPGTVTVPGDIAVAQRMLHSRQLGVFDQSTDDPRVRQLMDENGTTASVVAPLFAGDEFLGVVAANYKSEVNTAVTRSATLHERLSGLADQAATALQNVRLLEQVSHVAWHDALTGLPNRRLLEDRVDQEIVRGRRVGEAAALFFVDLDRFKEVNDTMGHSTGDELIRQVAGRLVDTVRRQDTVARLGGDEFAVLLPGLADPAAIELLAKRCLDAVSTPYVIGGREVRTSASIGIALTPEHGHSYPELLARADEAMYRSKALGRNTFVTYSTDGSGPTGRAAADDVVTELEAGLEQAIERGELFLLYQPYIDVRTTRVVGVEALVRWRHPSLGVLEPGAFLPTAERSSIIVRLDTWVLEQACAQMNRWIRGGMRPLRLSVNLSGRDLYEPGLVERIASALHWNGLEPSLLELEIGGAMALDGGGVAVDTVDRLRELGILVSFTGPGGGTTEARSTGPGTFPLTTLRIDRSFVQVLGAEGDPGGLISAIVHAARSLGLECVTESSDPAPRSRVLLQRGLSTAQGFFFSPPLLPGDVARMLLEGPSQPSRLGDGAVADPVDDRVESPVRGGPDTPVGSPPPG